jgi:Flp pilus assembly protein TadG
MWWGTKGRVRGQEASQFLFPASQKGAQLYEFAVTLPIALLVFTGLLSFGVYLNKSIELTNSTSLAGQYLSISRSVTTDPCATFASALQNVSPYLQSSSLSYSFTFSSTTPVFSGSYTGTTCTAGAAGMLQGGSATIQVSYPCSIGIFGLNLAPGCTLISQVTEIIQ